MKKLICSLILTMVLVVSGEQMYAQKPKDKPLNISIYLDLSDRLIKGKGGVGDKQINRDTAIISVILQKFIDNVVAHHIVPCKDKVRIFFYPSNIPNASALSGKLKLDLSDYHSTPGEKKVHLIALKYGYQPKDKSFIQGMLPLVSQIYEQTIKDKKWVGSDIWGFFQNKVKSQCLDTAYRNILIVLTDGYIYHKDNVIQNANGYSYLLSKNINTPQMKLIPCNSGLNDLEVLFLEINPISPQYLSKMQTIIGTWLQSMGVKKYKIVDTDLIANTKTEIDLFLK